MDDSQLVEDLRLKFNSGIKFKYLFFWGHRLSKSGVSAACFSQWLSAPFVVAGQRYPSAEHFMMAEKAALFGDEASKTQVLQARNPGAAKALGRAVKNFDEAEWRKHRFSIVLRANAAKFSQNIELEQLLLQTGDRVLVEASPVDKIWGIGLAKDDERCTNPNLWCGLNLLGFALMKVRAKLGRRE